MFINELKNNIWKSRTRLTVKESFIVLYINAKKMPFSIQKVKTFSTI